MTRDWSDTCCWSCTSLGWQRTVYCRSLQEVRRHSAPAIKSTHRTSINERQRTGHCFCLCLCDTKQTIVLNFIVSLKCYLVIITLLQHIYPWEIKQTKSFGVGKSRHWSMELPKMSGRKAITNKYVLNLKKVAIVSDNLIIIGSFIWHSQ